jgi:gamma-glutamyltranspeptidase/glutathione hydrolase
MAQQVGQLSVTFSRRDLLSGAASLFVTQAYAQRQQDDPIISGFARHLPILADHGMVASQEILASRIGVELLKKGGNAVDAAIATGFALAVTLPRAGNIGGGGFMLIHLAGGKKTVAIDYREMAGALATRGMFLDDEGRFVATKSQASGLGVGVPGTVAGFALAHQKYGSGKFTLAQLIEPAIALAKDGIIIDDDLADSLPSGMRRMGRFASSRAIFQKTDGTNYQRGDRLYQKDLAHSLQLIAREGPSAFYQGEIAAKLIAAVKEHGGHLSAEDFAAYRAVERDVLRGTYRGHEIVSMPPPSSGGVHLIEILNILEGFPIGDLGHNSAATIHLMAEAMKLAYADRSKHLGDPDFTKIPLKGLLSKTYANELRSTISIERARPSADILPGQPQLYESDQTTHYSVVDRDGNAVSNTYTLNFSYGLGLVAAGTGILLNNELDDFAARENAPNAFGLLGGDANAPGARKRPLSSMSPSFVFKDGDLRLVTGSPGGSRIITIVLQIIMNVIDHKMNIAEATEAPRIHHQWYPDQLRLERGISPDTQHLLEQLGHTLSISAVIGSAQSIEHVRGKLTGASDTRQRGTGVAGY